MAHEPIFEAARARAVGRDVDAVRALARAFDPDAGRKAARRELVREVCPHGVAELLGTVASLLVLGLGAVAVLMFEVAVCVWAWRVIS